MNQSPSNSPKTQSKTTKLVGSPGSVYMSTFGNVANLNNMNIICFTYDEALSNITILNIRGNKIENFTSFHPLTNLEELYISNNPIKNLKGFPNWPKLRKIDVSQSPFEKYDSFKITLLLAAPSLKYINNSSVNTCDRNVTAGYPKECGILVRSGWIATIPSPSIAELNRIKSELSTKYSSIYSSPHRSSPKFKSGVLSRDIIYDNGIADKRKQ